MPILSEPEEPAQHGVVPVFAHLLDDASLLLANRRAGERGAPPDMAAVVARYLALRAGRDGAVLGRLVCPVSRLPELVAGLAKARAAERVELALAVDTGLGEVPKALSTAQSRTGLVIVTTVEMPAPADVDATWLERVAEFVPDEVIPVVEPRRPGRDGRTEWLAGVRRVAEHGCRPKLRCGGLGQGAAPDIADVAEFCEVVHSAGAGFVAGTGLEYAVCRVDPRTGQFAHGILNLLLAGTRQLSGGDVFAALACTDAVALTAELMGVPDAVTSAARELVTSVATSDPAAVLADLRSLKVL